jgi:hypothetical protein
MGIIPRVSLILVDASLSNLTAGFDPGGFFSFKPPKNRFARMMALASKK